MAASTSRSGDGGHRNPAACGCAWPAYMARYEPLERLGAGTNGEVFKAWDTEEKRVVAVKRRSATGTDGGDSLIFSGLAEVAWETMYLRTCHDVPSVVKLRGKVVPTTSGDSFVIMDYAGRLNLRDYMQQQQQRRRRRLSEGEARRVMRQLLEGVKSVHGKGIVHLDMRPENVILDDGTETEPQEEAAVQDGARGGEEVVKEEDRVAYKIGGFSMARMTERPEVAMLTPYSAPELLLHSCDYDERVDTWGLGCIMADLLSSNAGKPTFGRDGDPEEKIRSKVFRTVGARGIKDWPGYSGIAAGWKSKLPKKSKLAEMKSKLLGDPLRRRFPSWRLSSAGFKVLSGLLESNPAKRLTAAEALEMAWFQEGRE